MTACARLHNIVVKQDGPADEMTVGMTVSEKCQFFEIAPNPYAPLAMSYLSTVPQDSYIFENKVGASHTREEIAEWLESQSLKGCCVILHNIVVTFSRHNSLMILILGCHHRMQMV